MHDSGRRWLNLLAAVPVWALAVGILVLLLQTFAARVGYPYDLEWMEGGMLLHAQRVVQGKGLYVEPSAEFIPYIYPPLYSWVLGAICSVTEVGYAAGRTVSLVGTLIAAAALVVAVRREGGTTTFGVGALALYLSCYDDSGTFYDLVRIDGMMMALLAWSLVAVRGGWLKTGGLLLALAFATKHNAAVFGLPAAAWLWRSEGWRPAARFVAWSAVPSLVFVVAMQLSTDGLFLTYLLEVPSGHGFVMDRAFPGTPKELWLALPWTTSVAVAVGLLWARRWSAGGVYWCAQGVLAIALAALMRGHQGGYLNVLMPAHWMLALWGALALDAVARRWPSVLVRAAAGGLVAIQLWLGRWDPVRWTPRPGELEAGREIVARIAAIDGEVLAPHFPWLLVLAGKEPCFALIGLWDVDHDDGPLRDSVRFLDDGLATHRWSALVLADNRLRHDFEKHYEVAEYLSPKGGTLTPVTGWKVRPRTIWVPKDR